MHIDLTSAHGLLHGLLLATSTTTAPKRSSSGSSFFLILIVLALGAYLWMRPQRKRMRAQQQAQKNIQVGDRVITAAGIVGRVTSMNDDRVALEIAPGTTIEVVRRALGTRIEEPTGGFEVPGPGGGEQANGTGPADHEATTGAPEEDEDGTTPATGSAT